MKWMIAEIIKKGSETFEINEEVDFTNALKQNDEIRKLSKVKVKGTGQLQGKKVIFNLHIEGTMMLPCALTLDDVTYSYQIDPVEIFVFDREAYHEDSDEHLVTKTIELAPIVWQHVIMQKPLRIVREGAYEELKKQGIELESEEDLKSETPKPDPRLAILSKLLDDNN